MSPPRAAGSIGPRGADILLHERGYRFTPYDALGARRPGGRTYRLRCLDECRLDERGALHDTIDMYYCGFRVATLRIGPMYPGAGRGPAPRA